jgi:hypothetical protein
VPLLLSPLLAAAQPLPAERVARKRTVHVSGMPGDALPELHVAGGTATVVTSEVELGSGGPSLQDERGLIRLLPVDGSSFIVLPSADLPEAERRMLTVPLRPGGFLQLALVTRGGEVDAEVRLVRLQVPAASEEGVVDVARLLNVAPKGQVVLALPKERVLQGEGIRVRVESVLRMGSYVFVTLSMSIRGLEEPPARDWERLRLQAALRDGSSVALPLLFVPTSPARSSARSHTLVALLPEGSLNAELALDGLKGPGATLTLPLGTPETAP